MTVMIAMIMKKLVLVLVGDFAFSLLGICTVPMILLPLARGLQPFRAVGAGIAR